MKRQWGEAIDFNDVPIYEETSMCLRNIELWPHAASDISTQSCGTHMSTFQMQAIKNNIFFFL